ncbi:MAG: glycoside hydrolase family 28 protein [Acholeplasmatales bacterium]|nr:glycoside hydrolase family 28 protein [Acholeplasmatales bacterium]
MKFNLLYSTPFSLSFELDNNDIYVTNSYDVYLNDEIILKDYKKNVFSLFDLYPSTKYDVKIISGKDVVSKSFETDSCKVVLDVKRFGAKGDGKTDDTKQIQAAILSCPDNGAVLIPDGTYYVCPLFLRSNITIYLSKNATLLGNIDRNNYPILPGMTYTCDEKEEYNLASWEGNPLTGFASLITGVNVSNVKIVGQGTINCNADKSDWWENVRERRIAWRPRGVFLNNCDNVSLVGFTIKNTPSWNLHPYFSSNLKFIDLNVENPKDSPNTDGCDPESCKNVDIIGVDFSVGDDCIAIKSGKIYMGKTFKKPSENFNIRNCSMNFGHGAIVLGSEMSGGIKNITVSKCLFNKTDRGLRIKTRRGRGKDAIIDGITFENIKMDDVLTPLVINMFYYCDPDGHTEYVYSKEKYPVDDRTPYLGQFHFKDIVCENVNVAAGTFYGLPELGIKSITLENIDFKYSSNPVAGRPAMMDFLDEMKGKGLIFYNVDEVNIKNVKFENFNDTEYSFENVKTINK